jgi:hypothetical protein
MRKDRRTDRHDEANTGQTMCITFSLVTPVTGYLYGTRLRDIAEEERPQLFTAME